jgi:hypothetical protein
VRFNRLWSNETRNREAAALGKELRERNSVAALQQAFGEREIATEVLDRALAAQNRLLEGGVGNACPGGAAAPQFEVPALSEAPMAAGAAAVRRPTRQHRSRRGASRATSGDCDVGEEVLSMSALTT